MDIIEGREIDRQEWMAELLMQSGTDLLTNSLIHPVVVVVESHNKQWKNRNYGQISNKKE